MYSVGSSAGARPEARDRRDRPSPQRPPPSGLRPGLRSRRRAIRRADRSIEERSFGHSGAHETRDRRAAIAWRTRSAAGTVPIRRLETSTRTSCSEAVGARLIVAGRLPPLRPRAPPARESCSDASPTRAAPPLGAAVPIAPGASSSVPSSSVATIDRSRRRPAGDRLRRSIRTERDARRRTASRPEDLQVGGLPGPEQQRLPQATSDSPARSSASRAAAPFGSRPASGTSARPGPGPRRQPRDPPRSRHPFPASRDRSSRASGGCAPRSPPIASPASTRPAPRGRRCRARPAPRARGPR